MVRKVVMPARISVRTLFTFESKPKSFSKAGFMTQSDLEDPLGTQAGAHLEAVVTGKVGREFYLAAQVEVGAAEELTHVVPQLGLGDEDHFAGLRAAFHEVHDILTPHIGKAAEAEAFHTEEILQAPHEGELHGNIAGSHAVEGLEEKLEVEGILEILAVQEVVKTHEEIGVFEVDTAIVLHMQAEGCHRGVLPEIEAAGNLHVGAAGAYFLVIHLVIEVVVNEEEGVSPIVIVETFEGSCNMSTIFTKIVENLEIGLGLGHLAKSKRCHSNGKDSFFVHKT